MLQIGYKKGKWSFGWRKDHGPVTVRVTAPSLAGAEIAGSGDMKIDKVEGGDFVGEIAGSGEIELGQPARRQRQLLDRRLGRSDARPARPRRPISRSPARATSAPAGSRSSAPRSRSPAPAMSRPGRPRRADVDIMGSGDVVVTGGAKCSVNKMGSGDVRCG